jgi:arylsulfatase A-like enzyme
MDSMAGRLAGIYRGKWPTGQLDISGMNKRQRKRWAYQKFVKDYLRCIAAVDENIGRILTYLDESGLAENTIVIYTSDQGYFLGEHDYIDKRWMFEESIQMPLLVKYPEEISPGSSSKDLVLNTDFAPTFLDYADASIPDEMQGRSFREILHGETPDDWRTSMYYRYWMHGNGASRPAHYGIRTQRYKLIFYYGLPLDMTGTEPIRTMPGWELYDLERDPHELDNVYEDPKYTDVISDLKQELYRLKEELGDTDEKYPELMEVRERFG